MLQNLRHKGEHLAQEILQDMTGNVILYQHIQSSSSYLSTGHGIHHVYSDAVVQIPVEVIGEKQHLQRNCASSAIHLTLRQTSKIRRMNCTPDVPLSFH